MAESDVKGFLLIKKTYKVRCENCGFRGEANLGKTPIATGEFEGADGCPVCGRWSLVADNEKGPKS